MGGNRVAEEKWHKELGQVLSLDYWDKIWNLPSTSELSNRQKFLQIQINNHVLTTNYTISKYNAMANPSCTFCKDSPEKISHLFFYCQEVQKLHRDIENFLQITLTQISFLKKPSIFGSQFSEGNSKENTIFGLTRSYIWRQKACEGQLNLAGWRGYFKKHLELCKMYCDSTNIDKIENFEKEWSTILLHL